GLLLGEPSAQATGQGLVAHGARDRRVEDREIGVDARLGRMAAEPLGAEFMEGADRGGLEPPEYRPPVRRVVPLGELPPATVPDALAQLARGLLGERQ